MVLNGAIGAFHNDPLRRPPLTRPPSSSSLLSAPWLARSGSVKVGPTPMAQSTSTKSTEKSPPHKSSSSPSKTGVSISLDSSPPCCSNSPEAIILARCSGAALMLTTRPYDHAWKPSASSPDAAHPGCHVRRSPLPLPQWSPASSSRPQGRRLSPHAMSSTP